MIFGDPYRFAIWVEYIPQWSASYKNGLFYFIVNGSMYPDDVRTSTLNVDMFDVFDESCALVTHPKNKEIFGLPTREAFCSLFNLAYPEPTEDNEYPEQVFDYFISPPNVNESGACFFAVANENAVRIIGGKTEQLVKSDYGNKNEWERISLPFIEDITLSKDEVKKIINELKEYSFSVFK